MNQFERDITLDDINQMEEAGGMTSLQGRHLTELRSLRERNKMEFFDFLIVVFAFGVALYVTFDGGLKRDWPPLPQPHRDDERRVG